MKKASSKTRNTTHLRQEGHAQRIHKRTAVVRKKITASGGKWDSARVIRAIRDGK